MSSLYSERSDLRALTVINGLTEEDFRLLAHIGPHIKPHIPAMTDAFYARLQTEPQTASHVAGRVDQLKKTHQEWLNSLFDGNYGADFVARQERIGQAHVSAKIPPLFVASSMSFLRAAFTELLDKVAGEAGETMGRCSSAVLRMLDLSQYLIDRAYEEDRLDRLVEATGMSRKLLENLISLRQK
jgi:hypothetical protein